MLALVIPAPKPTAISAIAIIRCNIVRSLRGADPGAGYSFLLFDHFGDILTTSWFFAVPESFQNYGFPFIING